MLERNTLQNTNNISYRNIHHQKVPTSFKLGRRKTYDELDIFFSICGVYGNAMGEEQNSKAIKFRGKVFGFSLQFGELYDAGWKFL